MAASRPRRCEFLTLPWRGRVATKSRGGVASKSRASTSLHPTPSSISLREPLADPPPPGEGDAKRVSSDLIFKQPSKPPLRAKRSNPWPHKKDGLLRRGACHRARIRATRWLLAMTTLQFRTHHRIPAARIASALVRQRSLEKQRAQGMPDARRVRSRVRNGSKHTR
jgi:hypothetical protein